jgi:hypothetical protein
MLSAQEERAMVGRDTLRRLVTGPVIATCLASAGTAEAIDSPPFDARTVYLRENCSTLEAPLQTYCFEEPNSVDKLNNWLGANSGPNPAPPAPRTKRDPGPSDPLFVDVGDGVFHGDYRCPRAERQGRHATVRPWRSASDSISSAAK